MRHQKSVRAGTINMLFILLGLKYCLWPLEMTEKVSIHINQTNKMPTLYTKDGFHVNVKSLTIKPSSEELQWGSNSWAGMASLTFCNFVWQFCVTNGIFVVFQNLAKFLFQSFLYACKYFVLWLKLLLIM